MSPSSGIGRYGEVLDSASLAPLSQWFPLACVPPRACRDRHGGGVGEVSRMTSSHISSGAFPYNSRQASC